MGRTVNFDAVPDSNTLPDGVYQVSIESMEEKQSKAGNLMYVARLEVLEPADFAGLGIFENFAIGNAEDPDAQNDATWVASIGARRMKNMLKAAQVPMDTDMDNIVTAALQQQLVVSVAMTVDTSDTQYKGQVRNKINGFYPLGHKEVGVTSTPAAAPQKLAAVPKAAAPAAAPKPVAAAPRPAPAPAAAAPRPAPAPAAARKPATAQVKCSICDTMIDRAAFPEHVEAHSTDA